MLGKFKMLFKKKEIQKDKKFSDLLERCVMPSAKIVEEAAKRGGKVVWLKGMEGQTYCTIAEPTSYGQIGCHIYWETKTGYCTLLEGGKVNKESYIKEWKWA